MNGVNKMFYFLILLVFFCKITPMDPSPSHEFLYQVPKFEKFKILAHHKSLDTLHTIDFLPYSEKELLENNTNFKVALHKEKNFLLFQTEENKAIIEFKDSPSAFEITSCYFSNKIDMNLLNQGLIALTKTSLLKTQPTTTETKLEEKKTKPIKVTISKFDISAAQYLTEACFQFPIEYTINKRIKSTDENQFSLFFSKNTLPIEKNISFEESLLFKEENIDKGFIADLLKSKEILYENKASLPFLNQEIVKKSEGNEITYKQLWERDINNYYADTRTLEKYLFKKNDHKLIEVTELGNNYFSEFRERIFCNPTTKGIVNNGTFFIKEGKEVKGYANIRFFPEDSTLFLNLLFFDKTIQGEGVFNHFYQKTKEIVLKKYNPKTIYFYTSKKNQHLKFWEKENFEIKETETPEKLKLICTLPESLSKE
jgi:hypothetical protein